MRRTAVIAGSASLVFTMVQLERRSKEQGREVGEVGARILKVGESGEVLASLRDHGAGVLRIAEEQVKVLRELESVRRGGEARDRRKLVDTHFWQSTPGRWHCHQPLLEQHYPQDLQVLHQVEETWLPLVKEYLSSGPGGGVETYPVLRQVLLS